ncbi:hypothetical protein PIB30_095075 [Stylosanthes scabra]|uniref:Uncharacterized protein n=1 Tax=Stylosanthes scabra TaxID=79078 RepID=A0ABU6UWD6_9FABA|nr:hypothetical protein [Stylosanthes scabra]
MPETRSRTPSVFCVTVEPNNTIGVHHQLQKPPLSTTTTVLHRHTNDHHHPNLPPHHHRTPIITTPQSPPSTHNHHKPPSLHILIVNRSPSHPSSLYHPRPIEKPPNISAVLPFFLSPIRNPNFCPLPFSTLSPATFVHRGTTTSPPPSSSLCSLKRATTYEELLSAPASCFLSLLVPIIISEIILLPCLASSSLSSFKCGWIFVQSLIVVHHTIATLIGWLAKTPTKGSAPTAAGSTAGNLTNCCSTHVFRRYPRSTLAKSTDTAFQRSSALTSLHYPFLSAQRTVLSFKCGDAVMRAVLVDSYLRHLLSYF